MGLFKFLKDKFSKKKDTEQVETTENVSSTLENAHTTLENASVATEAAVANNVTEQVNDASKVAKKEQKAIQNYDEGMSKSREGFSKRISALNKKFKSRKIDEDYFSSLEEILIEADCGVEFTLNIIERLVDTVKKEKMTDVNLINETLISMMFENYYKDEEQQDFVDMDFSSTPHVLLVCGVNGVGKTTSIAKLALRYINEGKKVLLVAADTFRAGATEQLTVWAQRLNTEIVTGRLNEDPASVAYNGVKFGKDNGYDLIIIDTAGRLQNKSHLMDELAKIKRVVHKEIPEDIDCFLVLDATTGQNGVFQAKAFKELVDITGIVITKMDGTSKGGIILAIKDELNIPVKFIGLGEKMEDLEVFDLNKYLYGLCKELIDEGR